ncbi:MAG: TldD/PmbA family protein [Candidatus Eremiobacteraeota bacterium]|nr:TldD/PmbA family protein [Candidatus Eremiobacteraeota bacterium]
MRPKKDTRLLIIDAMEKEQNRAFSQLRIHSFEKPYFISYLIKDYDVYSAWGSYGAMHYGGVREKVRNIYTEVRVGSHLFDNTIDGGIACSLKDAESFNYLSAPIEDDIYALRICLWRLTDMKYKEALSQLLAKKGRMLKEVLKKKKTPDFSREKKMLHIDKPIPFTLDEPFWNDLIKSLSGGFRKYKKFINSWVQFKAMKELRFFVNTEGTQIITEDEYYRLTLYAATLADDGMPLDISKNYYWRSLGEFPGKAGIESDREEFAADLMKIREAEVLEPYTGPAILQPEASAVFFHEAIGHRLEGERQISNDEGQTFTGKIGEPILPEYISIKDDPREKCFDGQSLVGHYKFDDEGVPAQQVILVDRGILRNFLLSRTPVEGFTRSNGHGRNEYYEYPSARMANFFVVTHDGKPEEKLKSMLIEEAGRQKKPYGLIVKNVESGETNTSRYSFQAFSGSPKIVYKVDLDSGRETLVRGVEFIGTPLSSINKILATGDTCEVHNAYCGAESGWIPISSIAPSVLVEELELQRIKDRNKRPPLLPPPPYSKRVIASELSVKNLSKKT